MSVNVNTFVIMENIPTLTRTVSTVPETALDSAMTDWELPVVAIPDLTDENNTGPRIAAQTDEEETKTEYNPWRANPWTWNPPPCGINWGPQPSPQIQAPSGVIPTVGVLKCPLCLCDNKVKIELKQTSKGLVIELTQFNISI